MLSLVSLRPILSKTCIYTISTQNLVNWTRFKGYKGPYPTHRHNTSTPFPAFVAMSSSTPQSQPIPGSLPGKRDIYDGLILDPEGLPSDISEFSLALQQSIPQWQAAQVRGIWLKLPIDKAHYVVHAVENGFVYHHAEPDYVTLTRWLPETENKLPPSASHQVGVGAFVFEKTSRKVLVVQEKNGPLKGKGVWKMPTGLVHAGEDITEAAIRECLEETGVQVKFKSVLAMRQAHGMAFGKSDMFFVIALEPVEGKKAVDQPLQPQEDEVEAAAWIPLEEYNTIDFHIQRPLLKKIMERCTAWANGEYEGLVGYKMASGFSQREDLLLFGEGAGDGPSQREQMGLPPPSGDDLQTKDSSEKKKNEDAWIGVGVK